jgi:CPA2 family monovalent cation:H+ antiporter-2
LLNPEVFIIVRTRFSSEIEELYALGASDVIPEEFETSIEIFVRVLEKFHLPRNIINTQVQIIRSEHYGILRGSRSASLVWIKKSMIFWSGSGGDFFGAGDCLDSW